LAQAVAALVSGGSSSGGIGVGSHLRQRRSEGGSGDDEREKGPTGYVRPTANGTEVGLGSVTGVIVSGAPLFLYPKACVRHSEAEWSRGSSFTLLFCKRVYCIIIVLYLYWIQKNNSLFFFLYNLKKVKISAIKFSFGLII